MVWGGWKKAGWGGRWKDVGAIVPCQLEMNRFRGHVKCQIGDGAPWPLTFLTPWPDYGLTMLEGVSVGKIRCLRFASVVPSFWRWDWGGC